MFFIQLTLRCPGLPSADDSFQDPCGNDTTIGTSITMSRNQDDEGVFHEVLEVRIDQLDIEAHGWRWILGEGVAVCADCSLADVQVKS